MFMTLDDKDNCAYDHQLDMISPAHMISLLPHL